MTRGSKNIIDNSRTVLPKTLYRGRVTLQLYSGSPVSIGFDQKAVHEKGIMLFAIGDKIVVDAPLNLCEINAICGDGLTAKIGYQTE